MILDTAGVVVRRPPRFAPTRAHARTTAAVGAIVVLTLLTQVALRASGGTPHPVTHLGYAPVVLAAYLFGLRGGLLTAVLVTLVHGPLADATGMPNDGAMAWAQRGIAFAALGILTGALFDRNRASIASWQAATTRVVERERDGMIALARGAEARDTDTGDHIHRVRMTSEILALEIGFDADAATGVGWSAMLHDVGKLHVPDRILLKPGPLDAAEWEIMRQHPIWGEQILAGGAGFEIARRIARSHHEDMDGSGYPDGLIGARIPIEARIVRVTDAFDAMTSLRPYSAPRSYEEALEELDRWAGRQFDPELVTAMIAIVRRESDLRTRLDLLLPARKTGVALAAAGRP